MSREGCVHLSKVQDNPLDRLLTFWFRRISLISPTQYNDPRDDSHFKIEEPVYLVLRGTTKPVLNLKHLL